MADLCQRSGSDRRAIAESRGERADPGTRVGGRVVAVAAQDRGSEVDIADETNGEKPDIVTATGL